MSFYNFFDPTRVIFGCGALGKLHEQKMPGKKALLAISDGKSTILNGSLARTQEELEKAGCEYVLFNKINANPLKSVSETIKGKLPQRKIVTTATARKQLKKTAVILWLPSAEGA